MYIETDEIYTTNNNKFKSQIAYNCQDVSTFQSPFKKP